MLKKAKTRKVGTRVMAWVLTCVMMLSLVGVMPEPIWADDEPVTSWNLGTEVTETFQGNTGEINTLIVDTTSGKLASNGDNCCSNFTTGAKLRVPVTGACSITVTTHGSNGQYALYTINGEAASTESNTTTVLYGGEAGYVDIVSTGNGYISTITVTALQSSWNFGELTETIQRTTGEFQGIVVDASADTGKLASNGDNCCAAFNQGTILKVPVTGPCDITVTPHNSEAKYALYTINGEAASTTESTTTVSYTGEAGYVEIVSTGSAYISKIELEYKEVVKNESTEYILNVADLTAGSISETTTAGTNNYFSLTQGFSVESNSKTFTVGDESVTVGQRMKTGGDSNATKKSIHFTVTAGTTADIYVCTASSSGSADAQLVLWDKDGNVVQSVVIEKGVATTTLWEDVPAGDYYIGSQKTVGESVVTGNINFYYTKVVETVIPVKEPVVYDMNVADLTAGSISETITAGTNDYFSLTQGFSVESNSKTFTVGDESVTVGQRMKTGGDSNATKKSIHFTVTAGTTADIYVCTASSSGSADAQLVLWDKDGNVVQSVVIEKGVATTTLWEDVPAGDYYIGSQKTVGESVVTGNINFYFVRVIETESSGQPMVDTVTAAQDATDETGATVSVSITGTAGVADSAYVVEASKDDGNTWIKVGTIDGTQTEGAVTVNLRDKTLGFGTWKFRVRGGNTVEASNSILYAAKTYTLSGTYNTGLEDAGLLTGLKFTATTDTIYTVPEVTFDTTNKTYSVVLEQGTTYTVAGVGVDEYDMITPSGAITYYEDTTLNLEFNKKVFYNITISLGSTPDLSGKNLVYTFTHADGAVYEFEAGKAIQLRDGVYTVAIGGDFEQMAYTIKTGGTLTVAGADVNHAITFVEKTSWSFANVTNQINGTIGWFYGIEVDATSGKLASNNDNCCAQFTTGAVLKVPVNGPCTITVTPHAGQAQYALYTINGVAASTTESSTTVEYTGEAGVIEIVSTGSAYIAGIAITYPAKDVDYVEQPVMPFVPETDTDATTDSDTNGIPKGNNKDSLTVQPVGQKLTLSQAGGKYGEAFKDVSGLGYYLFPITSDDNKLEFDVVITDSRDTSNSGGFLAGVFTDNHVYSLGLRGGIKIRGLYSKSATGFVGAGSPAEENIGLNREVHYVITMADTRPTVTVTFVDDDGVTQTRSWSQNPIAEPDGATPTEFYFGFMLANVDATITNMIYTSGDGKTVYYDQNDCYYTEGSAPVASTVTAVGAETREYIDISWTGTVPEYDGTYVVEMQKDGGEWVELTQDVTGFTYRYVLPAGEGGNYKFRVCGQLGKESLGGTRNDYATMESTIYVKGALEKPVVELEVKDGKIVLTWQEIAGAEYYVVYRYSSDEGVDNAVCVAEKLTTNAYTDADVEVDVPYYYYVKAVTDTDDNESPLSETVWTLVASEREGEYEQEKDATGIVITKKSYDTVFSNKVVLEGVVYGEGTLTVAVNGAKATEKDVKARDKFAFELTVAEGRNDVNLFFEDKDGNITRETFNFVYLTNYDIVVDADYEGTDGELVNGIPTYKTVQAAVNAAGATSTLADEANRTVILVMAGSYEERLEVKTVNITLIGEDRENTLIHFYPGVLGEAYEAGGDMDKRCATYIYESAKGFTAENISFANDYDYSTNDQKSNKSADAIRVEADNSVFVNVGFESVQDTLYMHSGKQYYYKCEIKGLVDFIYAGDKAQSYFNDCEIIFVYEPTKNSGYVCAPKTAADASYGLTFNNCVITAEEGCTGASYLLARPWGPDAYITWINCYMGEIINKYAPYGDMSGNMAEDARFYEYGTYGPGYLINEARRQISPEQAETMTSATFLGWDPMATTTSLAANNYVGTVETDRENYATAEAVEEEYLWSDGDDTGLKMFDQEGYADAYGVTGGGLLLETNDNYYKVSNAKEFLDAVLAAKTGRQNTVIELTADISLGCYEVENFADYSAIIKEYKAQALTHPTLIESGVSQLTLEEISNLTIFSLNGASIKHANITMKKAENIIIRNIKFDELWEWDEETNGDYDRNDWDYMTIDSTCDGIWIDHCTFYKAYDGIIDVKNPNPITNVTISWCEFLPGSENNEFFEVMMDDIFANPDKYPTYQHMKEEGMTDEEVYMYAYGQKKTHLFGQDDTSTNAAGIQVTLANNYYFNSMDRMPRLRYGYTHVYNCIMDAQELLNIRLAIENEDIAKKIVSNGAASTCGAQVLLESCYISGIQNALNSGNGSSPAGYINAINSLYYMNGVKTELVPKNNTSADDLVLVTDAEEFIANLPYSDYVLYDAAELYGIVPNYAGAGKLDLTVLQWEKTSYDAAWEDPEVDMPDSLPGIPAKGDMDATVIFMITLLGAAFVTAGFFAKKKFAVEE